MRNDASPATVLQRALAVLEAVLAAGHRTSLSALARELKIPVATVHRHVAALVAEGYLQAAPGGHLPGPRLRALLHRIEEPAVITSLAEPVLTRLAAEFGAVVQLGTFEQDMVTYRIKAGQGANGLFTRVGMQLEAYCSALGKVLLAHLPAAQRDSYLAGGPFIPLTARTITEPAALRAELAAVTVAGFARDDGEVADNLVCLAVPVRTPRGTVAAAISVSRVRDQAAAADEAAWVSRLQRAADDIAASAFGSPSPA